MKQKLLFLLTALMLLTTGNAWADDVYTPIYTRATANAWTSSDLTDWGGAQNLTNSESNGLGFEVNLYGTWQGISASKSFAVTTGAKVKYELDWYFGSSLSNAGNYAFVRFGNFIIRWYNNGYSTSFSVDGENFTTFAAGCTTNNTWTKAVEVIINTTTGAIEKFSFGGTDFTGSVTSSSSGEFGDVSFGFVRSGRGGNWNVPCFLKTLKVSECAPEGTSTNWTIKYRNESDEQIKSDVVTGGFVGDVVTASAAQMASFVNNNQKYIYKSGNTDITLVETAASNVITLVFREAAKYNYTITSSYNGNTLPWGVSGWCWEDENTFNVRYPRYQAYETKLVGKAPVSNNLLASITVTNDSYTQDLVYTKAADNLLYWSEAENMGSGLNTHATSFTDRVSNAKIVYGASGKIATLLPGTYQVALGVIGHANSGDAATVNYKIKAGNAEKKSFSCTTNTLTLGVTDEFTLTETTDITFTCDQPANSRGVDFVYITGTVDDLAANTDVTTLIKNADVEEDESSGAWQQVVKGWYNTDNVVNYRPLANSTVTNPSGAFTNTYSYENWTNAANGLVGKISQNVGNLPNGVYKLKLAALVRKVNGQFIYGKSNGKTYKTSLSGANETANDYEVIIVVEDNQLEIGLDMNDAGAGTDWAAIDNARLTYMPTDATVTATIGATGWTTFASPYALNLNGMTASEGTVKAYYASASDESNVTMTSTTATVIAGEGLMLKGTAGATITIPVVASGDAISGNMLVGCTTETPVAKSETCYVLVNNGGTAEFQSLKTNGATIPAGKAYLNTVVNSARLTIRLDEEDPTAINVIEAANAKAGGLKDGKYLIGNKIVLVKNGVKYGANGQKLN